MATISSNTVEAILAYRAELVAQLARMPEATWNQQARTDRQREIEGCDRWLVALGYTAE
jgi:hypothetical protein